MLSDDLTRQAQQNVFHQNTQEKTAQAAAAVQDVFRQNTSQSALSALPGRYDFSQAEIDHVLRVGGNTYRQRECIVAAFEKQKSTIEIAAYLQTLYHGGNGFDAENGKFVAWYDNDGIHLSRGQTVRFDRSASVISWQTAAERIGQLLQGGHFATNVELAEAEGYERSLLAEQLWHLYHDFNDEARDSGYLSCLSNIQRNGFPAETEWLADQLNSPEFRHTLAEEYAAFRTAYQQNRDLLLFHYHRLDEILSNLRDLNLPRQAFSSELTEIPAVKQFITMDEINDAMAGGSNVSGGKGRIFDYFQQPHTSKEKVDFLKAEYGIGGHSHALSGAIGSDEWHDGKGVRYKKRDCPDVKLTWDKAAAIITDLIHDGRYLSEQEQAQYQKIQEEKAHATEAQQPDPSVWGYNDVKEHHPDNIVLYQMGDFFEMYAEDAKVAAQELDLNLATRALPSGGRVQMCGFPINKLEHYLELLRSKHDVTVSAIPEDGTQRREYSVLSIDHEAEQAINDHEAEFGADGTRVFRDTEATAAPTIRELHEQYKHTVLEAVTHDTAYRNACGHSDHENAVIEGNAAIRRAVLESGNMELLRLYADTPEFRQRLHREIIDETYPQLHELLRPLSQDDIDNAIRTWNGDVKSKYAVVRYMEEHGQEQGTAVWLSREYGGNDSNSLFFVRAESPEHVELSWSDVQHRIAQLIRDGSFLTEQDQLTETQNHQSDYQLLDRLRADCEYFLGEGQRNEKDLWAGNVHAQIVKMRELYDTLPEKPEWLTKEAIDNYENRMSPRYQVVVYDLVENGFDEKQDYQTLADAEKVAQGYVDGTLESDGFAYDGAAVYDHQERKYLRIVGDFPDQTAQAQVNPPKPAEVPYVICNWSESPIFEDGKQYSIYEFDTLMKQADDERVAGKNAALKKYGTWEAWNAADDPELTRFLGYDKTQFTVVMPDGQTFTERQDIGDGDGGLLDFLNQYQNYNNILPILRQAALREQHAADPTHDVFQGNTLEESAQTAAVDPAHDVFQGNTLEESVQSAAADPARDVFQGNTLGESAQTAAADPAHDVFQGNTLEESAQTAAADPAHDVFQGNTLEESAQDATDTENAPYAARETAPSNFRIMDDNLGVGGPKEKFWRNIKAIATLKQIEQEQRHATPEEQQLLSQYVGWGGLADAFASNKPSWAAEYTELKELLTPEEYAAARSSTLNAHYTSPTVIRAIYDAVNRMGFESGTILEPSCGVGNFFGMLPESMSDSKLYGVELDSISGRIARQLYPNANIAVDGFEHTQFADNSFDLAIGNVPFGDYKLADSRYDKDNLLIHDYFFVKSLDKVKPNGVVAFITSKGTMDKKDTHVRRLLAQKADLLGAIRLPNNAFKANAGAEVTTDIIFLQKRETPPEHDPEWVQLGQNQDGLSMNSYFISHPEMILGEMKMESTQYGYDTTCAPTIGANLSDQLTEAIDHLNFMHVFHRNTQQEAGTVTTQSPVSQEEIMADEVQNYSFFIHNGNLYYKSADGIHPADLNQTATQRAYGMIQIRDVARQLIAEQADGCSDDRLHEMQATLNNIYDHFVSEYGNLHNRGNKLAFHKDAGYPLLLALEDLDDEQDVKGKSAIFTQRTIRPHIAITHADTPQDALGLSLAERGKIDFDYMSGLLDGMAQDRIISSLHGQIFRDPTSGRWQPADEYLSGNVREKLRIAKEYAEKDPSFSVNVKMLEGVQPEPLTAVDISVRLGTTWIPPEDITQFIREVLHPPYYQSNKITASYSDAVKRWYVENKRMDRDRNSLAYTKYGTSRVNGYELLELALNLRDVQVSDVKIIDGKEKRILNHQETIKARNKQDALRQAFKDWIYADPDRRARLVGYYNEHFNHTRPRTFNGDFLSFPGMNPNINMRKHQRDAVARILYGGNTLLAHCVGAGKTWTMTAAAMELRRLGLAHKPMFVVPNSITEQWGAEFQQLYPGANILVATENDFSKQNRKAFCARIATGDYDAVIIGHSQFEKVALSPENERAHIEKQIDNLELSLTTAKNDKSMNYTIKQLESSKKKLETRLKKLMDAKEKDDVVTFEQLGVDRIFVDEADEFKNLVLFTKMRNVAGIKSSPVQKSEDMAAKCDYLNEKTGYNGVVFATGTPISNSMSELYTMMRYLQYDVLEQTGMTDFDSWASNFGETVTAMELSPEGTGYRTTTRFAKFINLPELMNLWKQAADIQTADMLNLKRPDVEYHNEIAQPTQEQKDMVQRLGKRADAVRSGAVDPYTDNMLAITNDGRKLALDQRLADPTLPDVPESKLNKVVQNVYDIWEKTKAEKSTQLIFCDLATPNGRGQRKNNFCAYDDIRDKLIARGVPAHEIAYIHNVDTATKKAAVRNKMNAGTLRILLGSTGKMGAGFNVQKRLIAEHEVDCPWRPRDIEQREGRILRQGNTNSKVDIYRYATEGTFDSYNWQTVENKQKFIAQVMTSKNPARTCEDVDEAALSYAEVKALAAGDPKIKERMELEVDVNKLSVLRSAYKNEHYRLQDDINVNLPHEIAKKENLLTALQHDSATFAANHAQSVGDTFHAEISGHTFTSKEDAGQALIDRIHTEAEKIMSGVDDALAWSDSIQIGSYCGFDLRLTRDALKNMALWVQGKTKREVEIGNTPQGMMQRLGNALASFEPNISSCEQSIARLKEQLASAKEEVDKPWPQEDEYQLKVARLNELNFLLSKKDDQPQLDLKDAQPEVVQ
ncbi:LPD11 domain-containing protein [Agathobaculum sp. Marseille-P7918]|uniref:LPD11 domain-containing protein n=1 Tax=Agathobaculum sp. Marseille-P7918 TaxID=2479843 RepID=UPI00356B59BF